MGDSIPADDVLVDELLNICVCDGYERFCFNLFSEVVNSHYYILHTTSSFGEPTD